MVQTQNITRNRRMYAEIGDKLKNALYGLGIQPHMIELERTNESRYNRVLFNLLIGGKVAAPLKTTDELMAIADGAVIAKACMLSTGMADQTIFTAPPADYGQDEGDDEGEGQGDDFDAAAPNQNRGMSAAEAEAHQNPAVTGNKTQPRRASNSSTKKSGSKSAKSAGRASPSRLRRKGGQAEPQAAQTPAPAKQAAPAKAANGNRGGNKSASKQAAPAQTQRPKITSPVAANQPEPARMAASTAPMGAGRNKKQRESFLPQGVDTSGPGLMDDPNIPEFLKASYRK